jgi:hypothetical protein
MAKYESKSYDTRMISSLTAEKLKKLAGFSHFTQATNLNTDLSQFPLGNPVVVRITEGK